MAFLGDGILSGDQALGREQAQYVFLTEADIVHYSRSALSDDDIKSVWRQTDTNESARALEYSRLITLSEGLHSGVRPHSFGDDNLFFRIWFEPFEIDAGFIVEDVDYTIKVWNAYFDVTKQLTAITEDSPEGTTLTHDPLPITIAKFDDITMTLTVLQEGPPVQSTTYTFTIDGTDYETEITGIRVNPFAYEPDYSQGIRIQMKFETVIERNKYFKEQRRPLRDDALWNVGLKSWVKGLDTQKLKQQIAYGHDKIFGVPIYSEHCYPDQDMNNQTIIQCSNDLSKHWFLNNQAVYVILIQHDILLAEIKEISSVGTNSITLARAVSETFEWQKTVVYPIVLSTIENVSFDMETDNLMNFTIDFTEYKSG